MGDEDGGDAGAALDAADLLPGLQAEPGVQVGKGLVQQQHPGHFHQGAGDGHPLLLAAGHLAGLAIHQLLDLYKPCCLLHPLFHLLLGQLVLPLEVLQGEEDVLPHGHVRIKSVVLEHQADAAVLRRQVGHVLVTEEDLAAGGLFQAADQVQRGALAAAGGAQQADQLPIGDLKGEVVDGGHIGHLFVVIGENLGQILQYNFHGVASLAVNFRVELRV